MPQFRDTCQPTLPASWDDAVREHFVFSSFDLLLIYFARAAPDRIEMNPAGEACLYWSTISARPIVHFKQSLFSVIEYGVDTSIGQIVQTESVDEVFLNEQVGLASRLPRRLECA